MTSLQKKCQPLSKIIFSLVFALILFLAGCSNHNSTINTSDQISALPNTVSWPQEIIDNTDYDTNKMAELGKLLFWDPILSGPRTVACGTCHNPNQGYSDGRDISRGVNRVTRNSQTVVNTAYNGIDVNNYYHATNSPMFWDSRANSLEEQAIIPILSEAEMRGTAIAEADILNEVISRLDAIDEYKEYFSEAFGSSDITEERIGQAIAAFERTIVAPNSPFDQYMNGDTSALTSAEIDGMETFINVGCAACHGGPMFSDFEPKILEVPDLRNSPADGGIDGTGAFRTPTLRNLSSTAPYMHNGSLNTLRDVLDFYRDHGGRRAPDNASQELKNLDLNRGDINPILTFLNTLNDDNFDKVIPSSVPSGLTVGGVVGN